MRWNWLHPYRMLLHWRRGQQPPTGIQIIKAHTNERVDLEAVFTGYDHGLAEWTIPYTLHPGDSFIIDTLPGLTTLGFRAIVKPNRTAH